MALNLNKFNRIINLTFYTTAGSKKIIRCPIHGRKPDIEINGTYRSDGFLGQYNITVKNLYFDLQTEQYAKIEVEAGYVGNTVTITGTILTMYQESPGPDGKTVIQCQWGDMQKWLDATVQLNYDAGTSLTEILKAIQNKIGLTQTKPGTKAGTLTTKEPFMYDGSARGALRKIEQMYGEENLVLFVRDTTLYAECLASGDFAGIKIMEYMSAPPQPNTGGSDGTYYTTLTGPWMPDLQMFDKLIIPQRVYIRNFNVVENGKTQAIQVTGLSFHFGTCGSVNSMTVQGPKG